MRSTLLLIFTFLIIFSCSGQTPTASETVVVNNKKIYYESYGSGDPIFFFHGYSLSSQSWLPFVPEFSKDNKVIIVDLTGHGKSDPFTQKLDIHSVGEDMNALVRHLGYDRIKAVGFSFGGDVLYQLALINPQLIESMITIGAVGTWSIHNFLEYKDVFTFENKKNFPWMDLYHQDDDQIRAIMKEIGNYSVEVTNEELQSIQADVLIMMGDDDEGMNLEETFRVRQHLPNSDLWILPNVAHSAHEGAMMEDFIRHAKAFFSKEE